MPSRRGRRLLTALLAAAISLYGAAALIDILGGACKGVDFLDDPTYRCNTGADIAFVLAVLAVVTIAIAAAGTLVLVGRRLIRRLSRDPH